MSEIHADPLLLMLVGIVEAESEGRTFVVSVDIIVDGQILKGTLISERQYLHSLSESFSQAHEAIQDKYQRENTPHSNRLEALLKSLDQLRRNFSGAAIISKEPADAPPCAHVQLEEVGKIYRILLTSISGFAWRLQPCP